MTSLTVPTAVDAAASDAARRVLKAAPTDGPTYALVSGGHDSLTAMHITHQAPWVDLDGIIHINTGIGVPETREFVERRARELGLDYYEVGKPYDHIEGSEYRYLYEEYAKLILEYGFPGPGAHKWMYLNLKEKPLQRFLTDTFAGQDLTLVSGVSRHESDRRKMNVAEEGEQEYLGYPTISPLVDFTGLDVRRYRRGLDLPMNPVVDSLEMSGECLCGSFSGRGELRMLRLFYPHVWRRILCLESSVRVKSSAGYGPDEEYTRWGHNRLKDHERDALNDNDQMLLCTSCEQDCDGDGGGY